MFKTFKQAVEYLERYIPTPDKKHPGELGLTRMQYLMDLLGNPQLEYPTIHIGGTSGKGSTSTIIASILATKYKVGLHTSPHLVKITERIKLNGTDITDTDFIGLINKIRPFIDRIENSQLGSPNYFEIVAAMAFLYFYLEKVDLAVIEVGMGGKYDATNVIKPLVAVLTNVGLDHTEILGDTVEKIAKDKVGIIKSGVEVVSGVRQPSVIEIISAKCKKSRLSGIHDAVDAQSSQTASGQNTKLSLLNKDFKYEITKMNREGSVFDYKGDRLLKNLKLKLLGGHQIENAALAIRVVELLYPHSGDSERSVEDSRIRFWTSQNDLEKSIRQGLKRAFIPGRFEIISKHPLVILDGAHNPDKVKALISSIKKIFPSKKVTSIVAIKNDKDARDILSQLLEISRKMIFTGFQLTGDVGIISSYDPKNLLTIAQIIQQQRYASRHTKVVRELSVVGDAEKALEETIKSAKPDDLILVTGSLYLVGEIKKYANMQINK